MSYDAIILPDYFDTSTSTSILQLVMRLTMATSAGAVPVPEGVFFGPDGTSFLELGGIPWSGLRTRRRWRHGVTIFLKGSSCCSRSLDGAARVNVTGLLGRNVCHLGRSLKDTFPRFGRTVHLLIFSWHNS